MFLQKVISSMTPFRGSEYLVWLVITQLQWIGSLSVDKGAIWFGFWSHIFQDIWREDVVSLTIIDITTTIFIKNITTTPNLEEDVPLYASFERGSNGHGTLNSGRYVKHRTWEDFSMIVIFYHLQILPGFRVDFILYHQQHFPPPPHNQKREVIVQTGWRGGQYQSCQRNDPHC